MSARPLATAKRIATKGLSFRIARDSGTFPPPDVANAFFRCGYDDLPDATVLEWKPFHLADAEYDALFARWRSRHPEAAVRRLRVRGPDFSKWFTRALA